VHVDVSWAQPHMHDKDEREGDDGLSYGNSIKTGGK
jgi:hypothetical protein